MEAWKLLRRPPTPPPPTFLHLWSRGPGKTTEAQNNTSRCPFHVSKRARTLIPGSTTEDCWRQQRREIKSPEQLSPSCLRKRGLIVMMMMKLRTIHQSKTRRDQGEKRAPSVCCSDLCSRFYPHIVIAILHFSRRLNRLNKVVGTAVCV